MRKKIVCLSAALILLSTSLCSFGAETETGMIGNGTGIAVEETGAEDSGQAFSTDAFLPEERRGEKSVWGYDDRTTIWDTYAYPYSSIAYISVTCPYGEGYSGSGFMVSKNCLLTAAHVMYCKEHECFCDTARFYFGYQQDGGYGYKYDGSYTYWYSDAYVDGSNDDKDYCYIRFNDTNVGDYTGWLGITSMSDSSLDMVHDVEAAGYRDGILKIGPGEILSYDAYCINYNADHEPGNSGGPVFYDNGASPIAIIAAHNNSYNIGTRITDSLMHNMENEGLIQVNWN